ncbi:unnamed protein product [Brugia timori]|uniref:G_PROTEIN_RECEP_F1_2 domain-containing protein n=1 Tax=Brugia timori TaxID=42155 RepID=A0A0R3QSI1_9BILA|nr:unnamed protein product [Brugia timori]
MAIYGGSWSQLIWLLFTSGNKIRLIWAHRLSIFSKDSLQTISTFVICVGFLFVTTVSFIA